jgi:hypothetical protein
MHCENKKKGGLIRMQIAILGYRRNLRDEVESCIRDCLNDDSNITLRQYALEGIRLQVRHYLLFPLTEQDMREALTRIGIEVKRHEQDTGV